MRWKCPSTSRLLGTKICSHTLSRGAIQETRRHSRTGKSAHIQRRLNLLLPTSCHSTSQPAQEAERGTGTHHVRGEYKPTKRAKFTYWLVKGCCTHWWAVLAGQEATGSPTYGGRSRNKWALGSRWGGGPAPGCPSQPWWLSPPPVTKRPHWKTNLTRCNRGKETVSVDSCNDLVPHRDAG